MTFTVKLLTKDPDSRGFKGFLLIAEVGVDIDRRRVGNFRSDTTLAKAACNDMVREKLHAICRKYAEQYMQYAAQYAMQFTLGQQYTMQYVRRYPMQYVMAT